MNQDKLDIIMAIMAVLVCIFVLAFSSHQAEESMSELVMSDLIRHNVIDRGNK